ncbi:MAG: TetR family transcriptional regulator [Vicinamibacteria bacterium]
MAERTRTDARARMIEAALDLFHRYGVHGTSVDQVLERSGTGKGQFSHYFGTKTGLVHAVLEFLVEVIRSGQAATGYDVRTWEELEGWFDRYLDFQRGVGFERSCPIGTIGNDVLDDQPLLRQDVRLFFEWARATLARFFAERRAAGELDAKADPDALADLCIAVMQGGMLITKITRSPRAFEHAASEALAHVASLRRRRRKRGPSHATRPGARRGH